MKKKLHLFKFNHVRSKRYFYKSDIILYSKTCNRRFTSQPHYLNGIVYDNSVIIIIIIIITIVRSVTAVFELFNS